MKHLPKPTAADTCMDCGCRHGTWSNLLPARDGSKPSWVCVKCSEDSTESTFEECHECGRFARLSDRTRVPGSWRKDEPGHWICDDCRDCIEAAREFHDECRENRRRGI